MDPSNNNSNYDRNDDLNNADDTIDSEYVRLMSEYGVDYFENHPDSDNYSGESKNYSISYEMHISLPTGEVIQKTTVFEFNVDDINEAKPTRITLPSILSDYVRRLNYNSLILQVSRGHSFSVDLQVPPEPSKCVKIVRGWKNFCTSNNIFFGDRIRFEFNVLNSNECEVTKVTSE